AKSLGLETGDPAGEIAAAIPRGRRRKSERSRAGGRDLPPLPRPALAVVWSAGLGKHRPAHLAIECPDRRRDHAANPVQLPVGTWKWWDPRQGVREWLDQWPRASLPAIPRWIAKPRRAGSSERLRQVRSGQSPSATHQS